jgi:hypothetical protein
MGLEPSGLLSIRNAQNALNSFQQLAPKRDELAGLFNQNNLITSS